MKILKKIMFILLIVLIIPLKVMAASANISVSGTTTAVLGNSITYTVTLQSAVAMGSWQAQLNYDTSMLQLTGSTAESGGVYMANSSSGTKSKTYTFTFKTLKTGSTKISVGSYLVYGYEDMSQMTVTSSSRNLKVITQQELEASYSKDNTLKSLSVEGYTLSPAFSKEISEYSVTVPEGTSSIKINAQVNDSTARVSGVGLIELTEGVNTHKLVVKAQNGSEKEYIITINVKDENPIVVNQDNKDYTVIKLESNIECPILYTKSTIKIKDFDIPACINENIKYTLVGLKDSEGNIKMFRYENDKYYTYFSLNSSSLTLIPQKINVEKENYKLSTVVINEEKIDCLTIKEDSKTKLIYATNIETNEEGFYLYDTINKTFSVYDEEIVDLLNEKISNYLNLCIVFIITSFVSILILLTVIFSKKNNKKRKTAKRSLTQSEITRKD